MDCGLRTMDCGLGIKYGLGKKTRTRMRTPKYHKESAPLGACAHCMSDRSFFCFCSYLSHEYEPGQEPIRCFETNFNSFVSKANCTFAPIVWWRQTPRALRTSNVRKTKRAIWLAVCQRKFTSRLNYIPVCHVIDYCFLKDGLTFLMFLPQTFENFSTRL